MPKDELPQLDASSGESDRAKLLSAWEAAFGLPPPPYLSLRLMQKALDYDAQCRAHGGLPAGQRRQLRSIARSETGVPEPNIGALSVGTHLVREWNGRPYRVEVVEDGFRMDGTVYPSLSAAAKRITGTSWSGPRFFGLKGRAKR